VNGFLKLEKVKKYMRKERKKGIFVREKIYEKQNLMFVCGKSFWSFLSARAPIIETVIETNDYY
jgi:hypothetical protein